MAQVAVLEGRNLIEHYVSAARRRRQPDPRQHLPRPGPERAAGHGGGVRRHRHAEERGAVPRRRAVRPRGHRGEGQERPHRGHPQGPPDDHVPGHQEPDRRQGCAAHPGGLAARPVRGADPELEDLRHLEAAARRHPQAAAQHPRPGQARPARPDRAYRRRARHRGRPRGRHEHPARAVGRDRAQGREGQPAGAAVPRARARRAGDPRGVQPRLPRRRDRRPAPLRRGPRLRRGVQSRARRPDRVLRRGRRGPRRCSSGSTSTSRSTRRSIARCGCRRVDR